MDAPEIPYRSYQCSQMSGGVIPDSPPLCRPTVLADGDTPIMISVKQNGRCGAVANTTAATSSRWTEED